MDKGTCFGFPPLYSCSLSAKPTLLGRNLWSLACKLVRGRGLKMERETVLYISDQRSCSKAISDALDAAGFDVVATNRFTQAVALLYILRSVDAVVLPARERVTLEVRSVRAMCPDVPIVILGRSQRYLLPSGADIYINAAQGLTTLAAVIQRAVTSKPATRCPRRCRKTIDSGSHHVWARSVTTSKN